MMRKSRQERFRGEIKGKSKKKGRNLGAGGCSRCTSAIKVKTQPSSRQFYVLVGAGILSYLRSGSAMCYHEPVVLDKFVVLQAHISGGHSVLAGMDRQLHG